MTTPASTDLAELVEPLKREVAVPGEFDTVFPNTANNDLAGGLADGFAQAQLDGFFGTMAVDLTDPAHPTVTPGLSSAGGAVCVLYAGERMIRAQLRNLKTVVKYEAAGAIYDVEQAASVLSQELRDLTQRRKDMLANILRQQRAAGSSVYVSDGYLIRAFGYWPWGYTGEFPYFYGYELPGILAAGF
jgi:hypothetical protein